MENENQPCKVTPYYCEICKIYCACAINLQAHFLGKKHQAAEDTLKFYGTAKSLSAAGGPIKPPESLPEHVQTETSGKTLEEQLNSHKGSEPVIGLQYITEYQSEGPLYYECNLCGCESGVGTMFMHVLGVKHKVAYLKRHYPEMADLKGRGPSAVKKLKRIAAIIEKNEGRKQIMVAVDNYLRNDDGEEEKTSKEAEDTSKTAGRKTQSQGSSPDDNKPGDEEQHDQNTKELKVVELDDSDSEEFCKNEDLLDYLQFFEIVNEDDASFILEVTKKLTNSLVAYRQKISENKNFSELNSNEIVGDQSEYSTETSAQFAEPIAGSSTTSDNDVTSEFFRRIRNMDVHEVAATLHKMAASNPSSVEWTFQM